MISIGYFFQASSFFYYAKLVIHTEVVYCIEVVNNESRVLQVLLIDAAVALWRSDSLSGSSLYGQEDPSKDQYSRLKPSTNSPIRPAKPRSPTASTSVPLANTLSKPQPSPIFVSD